MAKETEELTTDRIIVLCPQCKTNQEGVVGSENSCINKKCGEKFTPDEAVPVIVHNEK